MRRKVNQAVLVALADCLDVIEDYQGNVEGSEEMKEIWELVGTAFDIGRGY